MVTFCAVFKRGSLLVGYLFSFIPGLNASGYANDAYGWPGNVRELENAVERAVILARGDMITHDELPGPVRKSDVRGDGRGDVAGGAVAGRALKDVEKDMILRTLEQMDGNRTKTADIPGIRRRALQLK